jgi:3-dehydroquinate synthase class II
MMLGLISTRITIIIDSDESAFPFMTQTRFRFNATRSMLYIRVPKYEELKASEQELL